ncbi:MAG: Fe-S cluster assembly protein SufD [Pyrinomonadaceae bacterium]|nr:Fe-S cluster assembly protein SufD [Acidobacteriota bacterium]
MTQAIKEESLYGAALRRMQDKTDSPSWIKRLRESALERFEETGFPTVDQEDWKYTNVAPIARSDFAPASPAGVAEISGEAIRPYAYAESSQSSLVFVNGAYQSQFSTLAALPEGVVVAPLSEALTGAHEPVLREYLARAINAETDGFAALNTAFAGQHGAFIYLPTGAQVETPIHLLFLATESEQPLAVFPRVLIVAERESAATVIEDYQTTDEAAYFTNAAVEVFVKENARVVHYKVQHESDQAFHIAATHAELERSSVYDLTTITLGARLSRHGINIKLAHEGAECWVDGLYLVGDGQHADTHSLIDHIAPHCPSHQLYKGILDGKSRAVFNGKVFVHKDARQTDAMQTNKNLLLSREARIDTKPQLEIFNDDVKCAHGATVGQLEEEELFYLASRGLHPELARNLLTYGFAEELVEKIKIESIKKQLDEAILNRLHARLEA